MNTTTIHQIVDQHNGSYLEVCEQDGQVAIRRVYDDSGDGFHVAITTEEFRTMVDLLKPFKDISDGPARQCNTPLASVWDEGTASARRISSG